MVAAIVLSAGVIATVIDLRERRIPNLLTMPLASLGLVLAMFGLGSETLGAALGGLAVGLALMLPGHVIGATGAGDVKFLAALGTLLGPGGVLAAFLAAAIAGGVIALGVAVSRRRMGETLAGIALVVTTRGRAVSVLKEPAANNRFPYAPALAIGAAVAVLGW